MQERESPVVPEIVDATTVCTSFPVAFGRQIPRDNIIYTLKEMLNSDIQVVTIEGKAEIGKTTLLAQFAKSNPTETLSIFVKPIGRFSYDPNILLKDLCDQAHWILKGDVLPANSHVDDSFFRELMYDLQRKSRHSKNLFYFVVDGLERLPKDATHVRGLILDMLPISQSQFRFLITGTTSTIENVIKARVLCKSFTLTGFTLDETVSYFKEEGIPRTTLDELFRTTGGVPSRLASVRRILRQGYNPKLLPDLLLDKAPNLFEIEWKAVDQGNRLLLELLAHIAFDQNRQTFELLAQIFDSKIDEIKNVLTPLDFLKFEGERNDEIDFVSESFRKFACSKLTSLRGYVRGKVIDWFLKNPNSEESLTRLPNYFKEDNKNAELLDYLTTDNFTRMIEHSQSLTTVRNTAELGITSALALERDPELFRLGIQRCVIADLDGCEISRSEIEAHMAIGNYEPAMKLAQSAVLKQDRLRLLAVIARLQHEKGLRLEPEHVNEIVQLYQKVEPSELGENVSELASDLIYCSPELAINLVEKTNESAPEDRALDWAFAKLSLEASANQSTEQSRLGEVARDLRHKIKDPAIYQISAAVSLFLENHSATEIKKEVEKFEKPSDRLFFLRNWAANIKDFNNAGEIIEYALSLIIRETTYTPTATDLRDIATPLPYIPNTLQMRKLVDVFDTQMGTAEQLGPTENYIQLQLLLCQAEASFDQNLASNRILEIYYYVSNLQDLEVKTNCLAHTLDAVRQIDPRRKLKDVRDVYDTSLSDFKKYFKELLNSTADHYLVMRNVIKALAMRESELAVEVATSLNIEPRRDRSLFDFIKVCVRQKPDSIPFIGIKKALPLFADKDLKDNSIEVILERLGKISEPQNAKFVLGQARDIINSVADMTNIQSKCRACCYSLILLSKGNTSISSGLMEKTRKVLRNSWENMDESQVKIETGFEIASLLTSVERNTAHEFINKSHTLREKLCLDYSLYTYTACLKLAVRAFSGLLQQNFEQSDDFEQIAEAIDRVPSMGTRIRLWTDLALRCFRFGREKEGKKLVREHLDPLLKRVEKQDKSEWYFGLTYGAPAIYCSHPPTAIDRLQRLPQQYKDEAISLVINFINRKVPHSDPFQYSGSMFDISYEDAVDICDLLKELEIDSIIYGHISALVDSALWKHNKKPFASNQQAELANRLEKIIAEKFPNPRFIKHDGFKILARAQIARLRKQKNAFKNLAREAQKIPNLSDRVYSLAHIAGALSKIDSKTSLSLLHEAKHLGGKIPSPMDRIERYRIIASEAFEMDEIFAKQIITEAMTLTKRIDGPEADSTRRAVVDVAFRIDPSLATSLASSLDDDRARNIARGHVKLNELKKQLSDGRENKENFDNQELEDIPQASWMLLGSLNAKRIQAQPVKATRKLIKVASDKPLSHAFPIISYVLENTIQRRAKAHETARLMYGIYKGALLGCDLAYRLRGQTSSLRGVPFSQWTSTQGNFIVRAGKRDQAIDYLRGWLQDNASRYLKICDSCFGPQDLEILKLVLSSQPDLKVSILTGKKHQIHEKVEQPWNETYLSYWREQFSDQSPPDTEIMVVGTRSTGDLPIHDRWWLTHGNGLRLESSFNSLGKMRDTQISILDDEEIHHREMETDQYLNSVKREHLGEKLDIVIFSL